ncbi:MAG: HD domain-containing protein, partial [Bacillota bacterium]|nr:HD domain-containing protein [Bacillota bacterium]
MGLYRVRQFLWAAVSRVNDQDIKYIDYYLDKVEKELFFSLSVSEQKHSLRVAYKVEEMLQDLPEEQTVVIDRGRMIRAALLHDIGKIEKRVNIIDKSVLVILNKITGRRIKRFTNIKKIDVYYNHGEIGFNILTKLNRYDDKF